jgi:hypothetical protein
MRFECLDASSLTGQAEDCVLSWHDSKFGDERAFRILKNEPAFNTCGVRQGCGKLSQRKAKQEKVLAFKNARKSKRNSLTP